MEFLGDTLEAIAREKAAILRKGVPGVVALITNRERVLYQGAFGVADVATGRPLTSDALFRIASMTKSFTALSILRLRDLGRLSLEDPAARYVPELAALAYPTRDSPQITIRHLLTHSAGFPEDNPWGDRQLGTDRATLSRWLKNGLPFSNAPGVAFEYSNYGFAILGQVVALPTTMSVFALMGVLITSATAIIYGESIWDPVVLVGRFTSPVVVAVSMFTVVVATIAVNIAANVVSPANDFANAFPRLISFKTGGLITGLLGIAIQPWRLLADPSGYIYTWLLGYSGGLGSIAGVLVVDYWIIRRRTLRLEDLYLAAGEYGGWNTCAIAATDAKAALNSPALA